ncbi:MAG TPA: TauD/TfdA family dioxygenase [Acidimicrobiia bacterium]|jgi:alpha-ketoglutarate-dependent taurine dioxygenase
MQDMRVEPLGETVGAEAVGVDRDRLLHDPDVPAFVGEALDEHGVLLFRGIGVDDEEQVAFGRRLGDLVARPGHPVPEITIITQDAGNHLSEYFRGNVNWHIDGAMDEIPCKAGILSARVMAPGDGGTEFASTFAAYDDLDDDAREELGRLRVVHSLEATLRRVYAEPTPEQVADWRAKATREHPLVWEHRSGRKSLVLGATADHVVGMDVDEGRALLADLLAHATRPERVFRHDWTVGDLVIWDNTGVLHRVTDYEPTSRRELHRATVDGDERIQ